MRCGTHLLGVVVVVHHEVVGLHGWPGAMVVGGGRGAWRGCAWGSPLAVVDNMVVMVMMDGAGAVDVSCVHRRMVVVVGGGAAAAVSWGVEDVLHAAVAAAVAWQS